MRKTRNIYPEQLNNKIWYHIIKMVMTDETLGVKVEDFKRKPSCIFKARFFSLMEYYNQWDIKITFTINQGLSGYLKNSVVYQQDVLSKSLKVSTRISMKLVNIDFSLN